MWAASSRVVAFGVSGLLGAGPAPAKKQPFHRRTGRLAALGLGIVTPSHLIFSTGE
jgi:hypothetical protein